MHITSQHRLKVLFRRTPYADTFRYIQNFKTKQIRFKVIFYNLDHIPPQATPKLSEVFYTDILYTVNLDAIPASYDIKYIKELLRLDEQYQQILRQSDKQHSK